MVKVPKNFNSVRTKKTNQKSYLTNGCLIFEFSTVYVFILGGSIILIGSVTPNTEFTITAEALVRKCATISGLHNYTKIGK